MATVCGCDKTKYNIDDFKDFDYAKRYAPGELVKKADGTLWIGKYTNGAAGYVPTLDNSIFVPISADECYNPENEECNVAPPEAIFYKDAFPGLPSFEMPSQKVLVLGGAGLLILLLLLK